MTESQSGRPRIPAVVLGATGMVGQRLVALLEHHPWFELVGVAASERSVGHAYADVVTWHIEGEVPPAAGKLPVVPPVPGPNLSARVVFSALPADEATHVEPEFAAAGAFVSSNASAYRMAADVPLVVPEINPDHLRALAVQRATRGWPGALVTNPNCSTIGLTIALAPLGRFGLRRVLVTTLQSASGAGYPGVPALDLVDNVVPYIGGEEQKMATEARKILGTWSADGFHDAALRLSATCTRVPVREGHLECVSVEFEHQVGPDDIRAAWEEFRAEPQRMGLPSAPAQPIIYRSEVNRPQPLRDRLAGAGMSVTVGRLRPCEVLDYKFVCLSHNTLRGAAGAALLNAELADAQGMFEEGEDVQRD